MDALTVVIIVGLIGFVGFLIWLAIKTGGGIDLPDIDLDD